MQLCRKCSSTKLEFSKIIGYGEKMGKVFHYKIKCKNCGTKYMTEQAVIDMAMWKGLYHERLHPTHSVEVTIYEKAPETVDIE